MNWAATLGGRVAIIGGGLAALVGLYVATKQVGAREESARVVIEATKTDAKAGVRKRAAEREPDRVLERYHRD